MTPFPELQRLAHGALVVLLQLAAALAQVREGDVSEAVRALAGVVESAPAGPHARLYADEALYWRARLAGSQEDRAARAAAARDYIDLLRRLPAGRLRREVRVRLAELAEPGRLLTAAEASEASRRNLERIGRALHDYAADNGGRLPGAIEDLLGEHITDPQILVRPGARADGGARAYGYRPGLRADLRATKTDGGEEVALHGGVPIVAWERALRPDGKRKRGARLVLRLDGEVRSVQVTRGSE